MITLKKILYNSLITTLCHIRYATFMTSGYGRRNDFHMLRLTNQLIPPLFHLRSIDYPNLGTPCRSKFSVPPIPQKVWKNNKKIYECSKTKQAKYFIRQPKVKSVSSFIRRYPRDSFYTSKEVTA